MLNNVSKRERERLTDRVTESEMDRGIDIQKKICQEKIEKTSKNEEWK